MTEFAFDITLTAAIRVTADQLEDAVRFLRAELQSYSPSEVGHHMPTGGTDVESAIITGMSLGTLDKGEPQFDIRLFEVDDDSTRSRDMPIVLDDMATPVLCDKFDADDEVACETVYDEERGDGYMGECPAHADASQDDD